MKRFVSRFTIHCPEGLRARLFCLAVLAVLPLGMVRLAERSAEADRALAGASDYISDVADRGVESARNVMDGARGTLEILRNIPVVRNHEGEECSRFLDKVLEGRPWAITLTVLDSDGISRCSTGRDAVGVSFSDRDYVQEAISSRTFAVSRLLIARVTRRPTIAIAMPALEKSRLSSVIVATLDLDRLEATVAKVKTGVQGGVAFIMRDGAKQSLDAQIVERAGASRTGVARGFGTDGVERLYAVRLLPYTSARLVIGMPVDEALSTVVQRDWRTAGEIVSIALLIAGAIGFGGDFLLLRPLRALGRAARDWGRGDLAARAVLPAYPANEFVLLAKSMNAMAERIANREQLLASARDELVGLAFKDSLTKIANRRSFEQRLAETWEGWMDEGRQLAIVMIDVDYFKNYNDRYGHQAGDVVLQLVADRIQSSSEVHGSFAARLGGEEFGVIVAGDERRARQVAEEIRASISALSVEHMGSSLGHVTVSIGCAAVATESARSTSDIMQAADVRLYIAKKLGRNCVAASAELDRFSECDDDEPLKSAA